MCFWLVDMMGDIYLCPEYILSSHANYQPSYDHHIQQPPSSLSHNQQSHNNHLTINHHHKKKEEEMVVVDVGVNYRLSQLLPPFQHQPPPSKISSHDHPPSSPTQQITNKNTIIFSYLLVHGLLHLTGWLK